MLRAAASQSYTPRGAAGDRDGRNSTRKETVIGQPRDTWAQDECIIQSTRMVGLGVHRKVRSRWSDARPRMRQGRGGRRMHY